MSRRCRLSARAARAGASSGGSSPAASSRSSSSSLGILAVWYAGAAYLNAPFQRELDVSRRADPGAQRLRQGDLGAGRRPVLPAPHQVAEELYKTVVLLDPTSKRSLVYHGWITLSSTLAGFVLGTLLGILLAVLIVHARSLDRSLMPWIVSSQTIPILAIAPMIVVVTYNWLTGQFGVDTNVSRFLAKSLISTYLSFFPVTVGMVKGLRSPEPMHLDLMRTYNATRLAGVLEAALAGGGALPLRLDEDRDRGEPRRRHRRRASDRRRRRPRRPAPHRLLLRPDRADLGGAGRRRVMAGVLVAIVGIANRIVLRRMGARPA